MSEREIDDVTSVETTGHEWDGIRELNNPLPRWWLWTFYGCIVFALGYTIAFPAWPMISSATTGLLHPWPRSPVAAALTPGPASFNERGRAMALQKRHGFVVVSARS